MSPMASEMSNNCWLSIRCCLMSRGVLLKYLCSSFVIALHWSLLGTRLHFPPSQTDSRINVKCGSNNKFIRRVSQSALNRGHACNPLPSSVFYCALGQWRHGASRSNYNITSAGLLVVPMGKKSDRRRVWHFFGTGASSA